MTQPIKTKSMIMTNDGIAFVIDNVPYSCTKSHLNYAQIVEAAKAGEFDRIPTLISTKIAIERVVNNSTPDVQGKVVVHDNHISYDGNRVHGTIVDRILTMVKEGFDVSPMILFLENLYLNPSRTAVLELYDFLVAAKLPITDDGHFYAYKRVRRDYTSVHDGKTDNSIGTLLSMPRYNVDDNRHNTCSNGFHFCSYDYLKSFSGERTLILKINPRDVVTIPSDYGNTKGRANEYLVVGEVDSVLVEDRNLLGEAGSVCSSVDEVPGYVEPELEDDGLDEVYDVEDNVVVTAAPTVPPANIPPPSNLTELFATAEIQGYDDGYRSGRYNQQIAYRSYAARADQDVYNAARDEGYKDGRSHKVRKFASPGNTRPARSPYA